MLLGLMVGDEIGRIMWAKMATENTVEEKAVHVGEGEKKI